MVSGNPYIIGMKNVTVKKEKTQLIEMKKKAIKSLFKPSCCILG